MGKASEPPKCKNCGTAHWGPCYVREETPRKAEAKNVARIRQTDLKDEPTAVQCTEMVEMSPGDVDSEDRGNRSTPSHEAKQAALESARKNASREPTEPPLIERIVAAQEKAKRGRPATGFDRKAYQRQKAKERRAKKVKSDAS